MIEVLKYLKPGAIVPIDIQTTKALVDALRQAIAELESQDDSYCQACDGALCTAKKGCVALSNPPQHTEQGKKHMVDWYSVEGETRSYGVGMVECAYAIGRDEVVHVVTHESVKNIAMQHLPIQRKPLEVDKDGWFWLNKNECIHVDLIRKIETAHGIKE